MASNFFIMFTTRFYLDLRGKAKDGKGSVIIILQHNFSSASFSTGIRLAPNEWHNGKVVKHPSAGALNASLQEQKSRIDRAIGLLAYDEQFSTMTAAEIKAIILEKKPRREQGHLVSDLFREYVETGELKEGTKDIYRSALKKVLDYGGESVKIESLNLKWLRGFDRYLAETQGANGRSIYLRSLRAVCNYAKHTGIVCPYPFDNFQIKQEPTKKRSVPVELLREFRDYPTTKSNEMYRDYFFLMFYLIGINSKDLLLAKKSQVVEGRLEYVREKTGKKYSIKIEPEAQRLLKKYEGEGEYLLDAMDHCVHYKSFAREINDALKTIGPIIHEFVPPSDDIFADLVEEEHIEPIIPEITTYYARHTWATFAYEIGIQMDTISQALGHSFGNRTTLIYVKPDQEKVDAANRKVIDYLIGV